LKCEYYSAATASLVVLSIEVARCAAFYEKVLGLRAQGENSGDIRLKGDRPGVLVHSVPEGRAKKIVVSVPPSPRDYSALKPVLDVASLELALNQVRATGGVVTNETFTFEGITRHDVLDPDGNIIRLRCRVA
jgi:predicted enzyme related to lactoylglutathione lyase